MLLINEVKDGVIVLRDGSLRAVVMASAINFDLMSRQEQDSVEFSFQGFLNSLHFPIQIVIKSQKIDLDSYIENLNKLQQGQTNPLLADLMTDYIANIQSLVEEVNIMDKKFFISIPFFPPLAVSKSNVAGSISNLFKPTPTITVSQVDFESYKRELAQRVQLVAGGLNQMGIRAIPLNTQELVDLFYTAYNPDVAPNQKLIDANQFTTAAVMRGDNNVPKPPVEG
jgi:type IV secretory pathway VirB4 component